MDNAAAHGAGLRRALDRFQAAHRRLGSDGTTTSRTPRWWRRRTGVIRTIALAAVWALQTGTVQAAVDSIELPGEAVYPENVTATADGTLYVSSFVEGGVIRVAPGASRGETWIKPGAYGTRSTFGLVPDEKSGTLWLCSNDITAFGVAGPGDAKGSWLKVFDLKTGEGRLSVQLPGERTLCNDLTFGPDGSVYVTNTLAPEILRLKPGAQQLEVWARDPQFDGGASGAGLDGIAFGRDGHVYVNTFSKGEFFRVEVRDGAPGKITRLKTSRPLVAPDALRLAADGSFLMAEGGGSIDRVTIEGDTARIDTLRDGLTGAPTGLAVVGNVVWISEGQIPVLLDPSRKGSKPTLPFRLLAVPLSTR